MSIKTTIKEIKDITGIDRNKIFNLSLELVLEMLKQKKLGFDIANQKFYVIINNEGKKAL